MAHSSVPTLFPENTSHGAEHALHIAGLAFLRMESRCSGAGGVVQHGVQGPGPDQPAGAAASRAHSP